MELKTLGQEKWLWLASTMDMGISLPKANIFRMVSDLPNLTDVYQMTAKYWSDDSVIKIKGRNLEFDVSLESTQELIEKINGYNSRRGIVSHQKKLMYSCRGLPRKLWLKATLPKPTVFSGSRSAAGFDALFF